MLRLILPFAAVILTLSPSRAAADPDSSFREFVVGHRTTFSSEGHPKAKGASFTIAYPSSWRAAEGDRPNILQKFTNLAEDGPATIVIVTTALPVPDGAAVAEEDLLELFSLAELRAAVPPGAAFVNAETTRIDGEPAGIVEYTMTVESAGMSILTRTWAVSFVVRGTLIQVLCGVGGTPESAVEVADRMAAYKPLFTLIAGSIVIPENWSAPLAASAPPAEGGAQQQAAAPGDPTVFLQRALVGIVAMWGIGLAPGVVIRYFARRPLRKRIAFLIAAGVSALFWLAFTPVDAPIGQKLGVGIHWFLMFFVSGWIMSRGAKATAPPAGTIAPSAAADAEAEQRAA